MGRKAPTPPPYKPGDTVKRPAPPPQPPRKCVCSGCYCQRMDLGGYQPHSCSVDIVAAPSDD
ncbi:hypothetical protein D5F51_10330 [Yersinia hibernica]|uniref:Uncharacterized protein n=1 Tax=Yersinia hibernica TaxID=2339259 RepID=A0ABX5R0N9_9GAMM|nr:hypothetical protein D5F51_10330 [Yersinia hibernica]